MRKEIKIDNLNIPEEPNNFIVPFRFEKPIKPFSFEEPIYPFSVENIENQKEEINVVPNLRIRPLNLLHMKWFRLLPKSVHNCNRF